MEIPIQPILEEKVEFKGNDLICFCFNFTRNDIEQDYIKNGISTILSKIEAAKKSSGCDCANKNLNGRWCLADVHQVVDEIKRVRDPKVRPNLF